MTSLAFQGPCFSFNAHLSHCFPLVLQPSHTDSWQYLIAPSSCFSLGLCMYESVPLPSVTYPSFARITPVCPLGIFSKEASWLLNRVRYPSCVFLLLSALCISVQWLSSCCIVYLSLLLDHPPLQWTPWRQRWPRSPQHLVQCVANHVGTMNTFIV